VLLTRSPLIPARRRFTVRLACVKHAASVRPEPGSNSPLMSLSQAAPLHEGARSRTQGVSWPRPLIPKDQRSVPKESVVRSHRDPRVQATPHGRGLALTFGTLLSSQGADAHRSGSLDPSSGQLSHFTGQVSARQDDGHRLPTPGTPQEAAEKLNPCGLRSIPESPRDRPPPGVRCSRPGDV
jgi:hypothetical protein